MEKDTLPANVRILLQSLQHTYVVQPPGVPQHKLPKYNNLPDTEYQKFSNFMNEEQLHQWKQLSSSSGQNILPKEPQQSIFDIAVNKIKPDEKIQKTSSNLLKTKKTQEVVQEWKVNRILGEHINKKTHQKEYLVEWEAGDITFEEESQFIGTDGSENEAFTVYKQNRKELGQLEIFKAKKPKKNKSFTYSLFLFTL